jgi:hypothetical protein
VADNQVERVKELCVPHALPLKECVRCNKVAGLVVSPLGGIQSKLDERPSLLPPRACMMVSRIMGIKARQYGEWNWKKINNADNFDHAMAHAFKHVEGDRSEFHPANLACRALFYLEGLLEKGHDYDLTYLGIGSDSQGEVSPLAKEHIPSAHELHTREDGYCTICKRYVPPGK